MGVALGRALGTRITLLGGFRFFDGATEMDLPEASERLLAYLAVKGRAMHRSTIAGTFWPDAAEKQAFANLRSALWRLAGPARRAVEAGPRTVGLAPDVHVDLVAASALARRAVDATVSLTDDELLAAPDLLAEDLLVGWYDEWVVYEAERWRQLRLHALEAVATRLIEIGRISEAVDAALLCVEADPLRETAHTVEIAAHLAENNASEAIRTYNRYSATLHKELGLEPSEHLTRLVPSPARSASSGRSAEARR